MIQLKELGKKLGGNIQMGKLAPLGDKFVGTQLQVPSHSSSLSLHWYTSMYYHRRRRFLLRVSHLFSSLHQRMQSCAISPRFPVVHPVTTLNAFASRERFTSVALSRGEVIKV